MKPSLLLLIASLILIPYFGMAENLVKNSSMDTRSAWKGDRKFGLDEANNVLVLEANHRKPVSFYQDIDTKKLKDLVIKFRYKSQNYKGRGFETRGTRNSGGSTFRTRQINADGKWHEISWPFSDIRGSKDIRFSIELLEGEGEVYFDDIIIESK